MWNKVANIILRNRFLILGAHALLTVLFGYYAFNRLTIDNKYGNMLPKDDPTQANYLKFKEMFGEDGSALVIAIDNDSLFTAEKFKKWKMLGDSILGINEDVMSVISEAKLFTLERDDANHRFIPRPIFSDTTYRDKDIAQIRKEVRNNPLYKGLLYSAKGNVSLMMVGIKEEALLDKHKQKVVLEIEEIARGYEKDFGKVHFAGLPHMRVLIGKRIINEMYIFIALSIIVSSAIMYFFFRSIRVTIMSNIVVLITVLWALGTIGLIGYPISIMMALMPPLMIVIGIPNCIYLYNKYHQEYKAHRNKAKALHRVLKKTGVAMFLTNVTTAIGFMTFLFTNSQKFFEFGVISSINIMLCYVVSLCLIPIFASFAKAPLDRHLKHLDRKGSSAVIERLVHIVQKRRVVVYVLTVVITGVSIFGLFFMRVTGNITGDLPKKDPILQDIKYVEKNFGGTVPFEVLINYKDKLTLYKKSTLKKVEAVQEMLHADTLFAKSLSYVDFVKFVNMAYYHNDSNHYEIFRSDAQSLKRYAKNFEQTNTNNSFSVSELVDTNRFIIRVRTQMKDLGSYQVADRVDRVQKEIDSVLNPDKKDIERLYSNILKGKPGFKDSLLFGYTNVLSSLQNEIAGNNPKLMDAFNIDPAKIREYYNKPQFNKQLRKAINSEYFDVTLTGTSVVASEGTQYLMTNLWQSIIFAVISIAALMAFLFYSFRMVMISMIPNIIPMIVTAGFMGFFDIPLKPSNLLIFSIALGITVDNTIHFLARYRQELKQKKWDIKECVLLSLRETGLSIIYTSVILFFGFIVFVFSDFGGTQALGYLSAITYLVALFTNLILLPCLLLSYERRLTTKSFEEPLFEIYDEEDDVDFNLLEVRSEEWDNAGSREDIDEDLDKDSPSKEPIE